MESLSIVATIVTIAQDIAGAVATVRRNRRRCRKLAERVQGIADLLRELHGSGAGAGAGTTGAATRRLLDRLEDALRRALELVRSCQDSSCPANLLGCRRQAERFDEVDGEIDRCLLDLASVANRILIARLEKLLLHQNVVRYRDPASTETVTPYAYLPFAVALVPIASDARSICQAPSLPYSFLPYPQGPPGNAQPYPHRGPTPKKYDGGGDRKDTGVKDDGDKDDDSKTQKFAAPAESGSDKKEPVPTGGGERKDKDKTATSAGAGNVTIGLPVRTVNAGMHELVPPPTYGHWPYAQGFVIDSYYHAGAGAPSSAAAYYHHHHSPYPEVPDMFSDENPNACAVM